MMDIGAKEMKEKREKNFKSKKKVAIFSLGWRSRKKDKKNIRKRNQAHTHQKVSILLFSLKLEIKKIFCGRL